MNPIDQPQTATDWRSVKIHFGKKAGTKLGDMSARDLAWWKQNWFPNSSFCTSKKTRVIEICDDADNNLIVGRETLKERDPEHCRDCALRAAIEAGFEEINSAPPAAAAPIASTATGCHVGVIGENFTVAATVTERFDFTTEFKRKKVVQEVAILVTADGAKIKWKTGDIPASVKVGAEVTLTGKVKEHGEFKGEKITTLKLVKVDGAQKLAATHFVTLFCDGKSSADRIAVTNCTTGVLYAGRAGLGRPDNGDNTDHELAGALKALEIANAAREAASLEALRVDLHYDAQWMGGMVGKAKPIRDYAKAHNLIVNMIKIAGVDNPADEWTVSGGERRPTGDLAALVTKI